TGPFVWTTYAALQSLTTGMERSKSEEPADIIKNLKAQPVDTVMGPLSWDDKGDLKGFEFGIFEWHADGSSTAVK
ncbi:MAG: leucine ABC transporter subunit substrate-binding protein LivK, partial [Hafniaceae bacterium]|nr:leucine ABC transporter subunit substrate-binding protein LivK [Hafniaceae bacterium]